jgi:hypothetical protein
MKRVSIAFLTLIALFLAGCVAVAPSGRDFNAQSENGLVVISFVDRALFTPAGGAIAIANQAGEKQWVIFSGKGDEPIKASDGKGGYYYRTAALKPGKYTITNWRLHNSSGGESLSPPKTKLEFEVVGGKAIYLGSFNVIRFAENAQFRDRYEDDRQGVIRFFPSLAPISLENRSFVSDWWPLPGGTDMAKISNSPFSPPNKSSP